MKLGLSSLLHPMNFTWPGELPKTSLFGDAPRNQAGKFPADPWLWKRPPGGQSHWFLGGAQAQALFKSLTGF